jgi:hypothetical protein
LPLAITYLLLYSSFTPVLHTIDPPSLSRALSLIVCENQANMVQAKAKAKARKEKLDAYYKEVGGKPEKEHYKKP